MSQASVENVQNLSQKLTSQSLDDPTSADANNNIVESPETVVQAEIVVSVQKKHILDSPELPAAKRVKHDVDLVVVGEELNPVDDNTPKLGLFGPKNIKELLNDTVVVEDGDVAAENAADENVVDENEDDETVEADTVEKAEEPTKLESSQKGQKSQNSSKTQEKVEHAVKKIEQVSVCSEGEGDVVDNGDCGRDDKAEEISKSQETTKSQQTGEAQESSEEISKSQPTVESEEPKMVKSERPRRVTRSMKLTSPKKRK